MQILEDPRSTNVSKACQLTLRSNLTEPELRTSLKKLIVDSLRLDEVKPETIGDDSPLFSPTEGLGLDSLSALELLAAIEFQYKITFENEGAREHFKSVNTLTAYLLPRLKN